MFSLAACFLNRGSLEIEAQIIYNLGGPQPIARQTFYLLDSDFASLTKSMFKDNKTPDNATIESGGALVALLYMIERKEELRKEGVINVF
jgi:hypothetical protein